jgi:hypothetical protein
MKLKTIPHSKPNLFKRFIGWFNKPKLNAESIETTTFKIDFYSCSIHFVEGYGRKTCPYCEDKEYNYKPHEWTDGKSLIINGARQIKIPKASKR